MWCFDIDAARSEALFVSTLQLSEHPTGFQIREAIRRAVREFGSRGCAALVAQEYGDHPEYAVARMRWARRMVEQTFVPTRPPRMPRYLPTEQAA